MDWTQTIVLGGTLITYMTGMCLFFYRLNEKEIQETKNIIKEWRKEHVRQIETNELRWQEMFKYMNSRIDSIVESKIK